MFVTANTFFNHRGMLRYRNRPFETVKEMNDEMILRWNKIVPVGKSYPVYHLGNFGFGSVETLKSIRAQLNGKIILVAGPHDPPNREAIRRIGFATRTSGHRVLYSETSRCSTLELTHKPVTQPGPADLYISGHGDEPWITKTVESTTDGYSKSSTLLNVDSDDWGLSPVHMERLLDFLKEKLNPPGVSSTPIPITTTIGA